MTLSVVESPLADFELLELQQKYSGREGIELLSAMINDEFVEKIAMVSSFGAESAVLLHMVSQVDPTTPILFLNTGKVFAETLRYRDNLQTRLGLTDVRAIGPHPDDEKATDPEGSLWQVNPDGCCDLRKVRPLTKALKNFDAQITGRKRFQTNARADLLTIEADPLLGSGHYKINPLIRWGIDELVAYTERHSLPKHPLVKDGFLSIGCMPCTERVQPGGQYRDGRWAGMDKDECGIHIPENLDGDGI